MEFIFIRKIIFGERFAEKCPLSSTFYGRTKKLNLCIYLKKNWLNSGGFARIDLTEILIRKNSIGFAIVISMVIARKIWSLKILATAIFRRKREKFLSLRNGKKRWTTWLRIFPARKDCWLCFNKIRKSFSVVLRLRNLKPNRQGKWLLVSFLNHFLFWRRKWRNSVGAKKFLQKTGLTLLVWKNSTFKLFALNCANNFCANGLCCIFLEISFETFSLTKKTLKRNRKRMIDFFRFSYCQTKTYNYEKIYKNHFPNYFATICISLRNAWNMVELGTQIFTELFRVCI